MIEETYLVSVLKVDRDAIAAFIPPLTDSWIAL